MKLATITGAAVVMFTLGAALQVGHAQTNGATGGTDTRTAKQYDDYNSSIKAPSFGQDSLGGASAKQNAAQQYNQGSAQPLASSAGIANQDKH